MRADVEISNFTAGELSPRLKGRTDYKNYYNGLDTCQNMVVLPQGGATRRPGTVLAALAKDQTNGLFRTRIIPFVFSTVQAYQLEFSHLNVRIYMDDGVVLSGGTPVDVATPYTAAELAQIQYTQSADTLFLEHPNHPPATLTRSSHVNWAYTVEVFRDGPYQPVNITPTTMTVSGTGPGDIDVVASSIVGINVTPQSTGQGFLPGDVGRLMRIQLMALWGWGVIKTVTDTTHIVLTIKDAVPNGAAGSLDGAAWAPDTSYVAEAVVVNGGHTYQCVTSGLSASSGGPTATTTAIIQDGTAEWQYLNMTAPVETTQWRLGKWSVTTGWPQLPTFWQQRLTLLGTANQPSSVEASVPADFTNFAPTQADGQVTAVNALSWVISDDQVNAVRWVSPAGSAIAQQLGIGTAGAEQVMQPATNSQALSATNVQVYRETQIGAAANVRALRIGKSVLFTNRSGRFLLDWIWQWAINGYMAIDRTVDAEHITRPDPATLPGIVEMAYQQTPFRVVWCVLGDGSLVGFTFMPEQNVYAWHRHRLGGQYYGGAPFVESVSCIPSPDGSYDEVWLSVLRTIAGVPTRTMEVMARYFDGSPAEDSFFVDCGLSSGLSFPAPTLTPAAAKGDGVVFTASAGFFSGDNVGSFIRINGGLALVKTCIDATHVTADYWRNASSIRPAAVGAWSCTPQFGTFNGLDYLNGETVQMIGDGADMGTAVVAGGAVTLPNGYRASYATIGLPAEFRLVTMPYAPQQAVASVQGRAKRIDHLYLRFVETLGCSYGRVKTDPLTQVQNDVTDNLLTRSAADPMGQVPALFTGIKRLSSPGGYDEEGQMLIKGKGPYPCTVVGIAAKGSSGEAAP